MAETEIKPGMRHTPTGEHADVDGSDERPTPESPTADPAQAPDGDDAATVAAVPSDEDAPAQAAESGASGEPTRTSKLLLELSRAMQTAAEASRDETMARLTSDAKVVVEEIRAGSEAGASDLRRRADEDVAAVREWSKTEIARIREETEARITERKTALDGEVAAHDSVVEIRVERVTATVAAFEARMSAFMDRLRAEDDPTRIATMAETMPEPPDLAGVASSVPDAVVETFDPVPAAADPDPAAPDPRLALMPDLGPMSDLAAAEAEAAAFAGDLDSDLPDDATPDRDPMDAAESSEAVGVDESTPEAPASVRSRTEVTVRGLVSVASIAAFKRGLGRVPGVSTIGVASGPDGEFLFTVAHAPEASLGDAIADLNGFEARITAQTTGTIQVVARDPDFSA